MGMLGEGGKTRTCNIPSDANSKSPLIPVPALHYGHLPAQVTAGPVENLVRVAMLGGGEAVVAVTVIVASHAIMRVGVRHILRERGRFWLSGKRLVI